MARVVRLQNLPRPRRRRGTTDVWPLPVFGLQIKAVVTRWTIVMPDVQTRYRRLSSISLGARCHSLSSAGWMKLAPTNCDHDDVHQETDIQTWDICYLSVNRYIIIWNFVTTIIHLVKIFDNNWIFMRQLHVSGSPTRNPFEVCFKYNFFYISTVEPEA